jgi:pyrroline-5-carboxylate reductase
MIRQTIGLIGVGNMGAAIVGGLLKNKIVRPKQIRIYDKIPAKASAFAKRWGAGKTGSNAELIEKSRVVLIAVKPQDLPPLEIEARGKFGARHTVISVLAGTSVEKIRRVVGKRPKIVRAMPNLGALAGESVTALCGSGPKALVVADKIFRGCGTTVCLKEKFFDLVTAVSGSGPAYFFFLMELLWGECLARGLDQKQAEALVLQTALGAAKVARMSGLSPGELRRKVTSKGGTTEAAIGVMEGKRMRGIVREALRAAMKRGRELEKS